MSMINFRASSVSRCKPALFSRLEIPEFNFYSASRFFAPLGANDGMVVKQVAKQDMAGMMAASRGRAGLAPMGNGQSVATRGA